MQGYELKQWREANDWTLEQAARYLGTTKTSVHRWEAGKHPVPTTIVILASLLGDKRNIRNVENILFKHLDI
jgi:transcriptional regulator with XRE-family HTH domain